MAEEKIVNEEIKDEEILSDEELEDVAGGNKDELREDADRLRALGYLPKNRAASKEDINNAIWDLGQKIGHDIGSNFSDRGTNRHYIDGHKVNHKELWKFIYRRIH